MFVIICCLQDLIRQKEIARETLREEPPSDHPDCVKMLIKLPCGTRLERRFLKTDSLEVSRKIECHCLFCFWFMFNFMSTNFNSIWLFQLLYQFVFGHLRSPNYFDIATNFPKKTLACKASPENPKPLTFNEAGLRRNETLFVYDLES